MQGNGTDNVGDQFGEVPVLVGTGGHTVLALSGGADFYCAIYDDHQVRCWGENGDGQLARGSTDDFGDDPGETNVGPIALPAGRSAVAVSTGAYHACAAGSPTAQVGDLPAGLNVLSIEQHGDLVPLLDGEPNPPSVEQTTVVVDAGPGQGIEAHHDYDVYVAGGAAVDVSTEPSVVDSVGSLHEHGFLGTGGQVTSQQFQITRTP
jgi:hypothetical protein